MINNETRAIKETISLSKHAIKENILLIPDLLENDFDMIFNTYLQMLLEMKILTEKFSEVPPEVDNDLEFKLLLISIGIYFQVRVCGYENEKDLINSVSPELKEEILTKGIWTIPPERISRPKEIAEKCWNDLFKREKETKLPRQLKINSSITNKVLKETIPNINQDRINNPDIKTEFSYLGSFTAKYTSDNGNVTLKLESLNDIGKLVKQNKFNKFYDFMLHCLDQWGLDNGFLRIPYKLWLEYTGRTVSDRMTKEVRKEIREFATILKGIYIEFEGKAHKGYGSIPFRSWNTAKYNDMAEIEVDKKFIEAIGKDFYTLPLKAGRLSQKAYDLISYIMWYCRVNKKKAGKTFNLKYKTLYGCTGFPSYEEVKNKHGRHYERLMFEPMDKIIQEIREVLPENIKFDKYFIPKSKSDMLKNISITVFDIDYSNIIKIQEKHKNQKEKKKPKAI